MADKIDIDLHGMTLVEVCRAYPEQAAAAIQKYAMESAKSAHNTGMDAIALLCAVREDMDKYGDVALQTRQRVFNWYAKQQHHT